jgi:hypothetical protein
MNSPRYARIAARLFAQDPTTQVEATDPQRARSIGAIERALVVKKQRRTRRVWGMVLSAAAALALVGYGGFRELARPASAVSRRVISAVVSPSGSGAAIVSGVGTEPLVGTASLTQGGRLIAGNGGGATVHLSTGTELAIQHDTNVEFESAGPVERFYLTQGVLRAKVAKLGGGERFIVRTPDAEVEVHGTVFQVAIVDPVANCASGARTRVNVSEGVVEVRSVIGTFHVHPGEAWPADCIVAAPAVSAAAHAPPTTRKPPNAIAAERSRNSPEAEDSAARTQSQAKEASSIAQQNELFAEASSAHRQGDDARALSTFEQLMARYPTSPLAESAAVQRMHLLQNSDPVAARNAAREYLAHYPQGYARNDAERLLAQP